MKKISAVFASAALLTALLSVISITASAGKMKDPNCINRCNTDYNACKKAAKNNNPNIVDRMNSEDECLRVRKTCYGLCSERL